MPPDLNYSLNVSDELVKFFYVSCIQVINASNSVLLVVVLKEGDVPIINVLDRKWNNDDISSVLNLKLPSGVSFC